MTLESFKARESADILRPSMPVGRCNTTATNDRPLCPACGGLQSLCRPRFFPGQLLTDEDLNRLEQYVVDKHRLHNRHLQGWGVACGLEIICNPCDTGNVVVRPGYALSPCGDDIVVARDHSVDVCALIQDCAAPRTPVCDPPQPEEPAGCAQEASQWVLAICYDEKPSRGITPVPVSKTQGSDCGGTCSGAAGCGCGNCASRKAAPRRTGATAPPYRPQCEPTQICEGYHFIAYPVPKPPRLPVGAGNDKAVSSLSLAWMYANRARFGPLVERLLCCLAPALELADDAKSAGNDLGAYVAYARAVYELAAELPLHHCGLLADALALYRSAADFKTDGEVDVKDRVAKVTRLLFEIVGECACSALLPACPPAPAQNCVPLGVVTVRGGRCEVVEVCNWRERKLLVNWSTIGYWFSWLPWQKARNALLALCCSEGRGAAMMQLAVLVIGAAANGAKTQAMGVRTTVAQSTNSDPLMAAMGADDIVKHLFGQFQALQAGAPTAMPDWSAVAARLMDGSALAPLAGRAVATNAAARDKAVRLGIDGIEARVKALEKTIKTQDRIIQALKIVNDKPRR